MKKCVEKYGMTPTAILDRYGVFDVPTSAAHCVWVDQNDIEILSQKDVSAVHNPVSNMKLASGIAPVTEMLTAGINIALGTDGVSSNNSFDMFEEVKMASLVAKVRTLDPNRCKGLSGFEDGDLRRCERPGPRRRVRHNKGRHGRRSYTY
ncbi:MAG: amidohydrolase family protein [Eubacteriales bacterium]